MCLLQRLLTKGRKKMKKKYICFIVLSLYMGSYQTNNRSYVVTKNIEERYAISSDLSTSIPKVVDRSFFEDRTLTLLDGVDNTVELLAYQYYYYHLTTRFDKLRKMTGNNIDLQINNTNEQKSYYNKSYFKDITIYNFYTLETKDLKNINTYQKEHLLNAINTYELETYCMVELTLSVTFSDALSKNPTQVPENEPFIRYFLFGKNKEDKDYLLYEVYWDGLVDKTA